jgi:seryl-tRNA synthetase
MLDIKFIRENKDLVAEGARKKHVDFDIDTLLAVDDKRRAVLQSVESKRSKQNSFNEKIAGAGADEKTGLLDEMKELKAEMQADEEELKKVMEEWQGLMLRVPNVPDPSVPEGKTEEDNKEIKVWGEKPQFDFKPKSHIELMENLDILDLERGVKVSGFRGYFLKGDGALLNFALWRFAQDHFLSYDGYNLIMAPSLVKKETLVGTGYLPQGEEDLYRTQDGDYLAGTSEVPVMSYHTNEILDKKNLPLKFLAFSPCFRREAGSYGRDVKGLIRVHEFFKFEQVILCEANHDKSVKFHEEINRNIEEFIEALGIPYHTVVNAGGDLGLGQVKKYDVELWVPLENRYREIGSASYFHDFQTRRLNIKYRDEEGILHFAHSLNSTAAPTPRFLVSIVENNQNEDGSINIPEVLQPYMGGRKVIK